MFIFHAVLLSVVLVALGYICSWTSMHENTSKGLSGFGKVMAIILYVFAVLVLVFGLSCGHHGKMGSMAGMCQMGPLGKMHGSMDRGGMKGMKNMPEMMDTKESIMRQINEWKMNNPKEWKECLMESEKPVSAK
ncbi:MAG: hypothetical protein LHV68_06310 [Elusimicrobia bacterium]|nr:hypothetical protein [Candidatus Liberimonas magnetica]